MVVFQVPIDILSGEGTQSPQSSGWGGGGRIQTPKLPTRQYLNYRILVTLYKSVGALGNVDPFRICKQQNGDPTRYCRYEAKFMQRAIPNSIQSEDIFSIRLPSHLTLETTECRAAVCRCWFSCNTELPGADTGFSQEGPQ